jgi:hypothetical protein
MLVFSKCGRAADAPNSLRCMTLPGVSTALLLLLDGLLLEVMLGPSRAWSTSCCSVRVGGEVNGSQTAPSCAVTTCTWMPGTTRPSLLSSLGVTMVTLHAPAPALTSSCIRACTCAESRDSSCVPGSWLWLLCALALVVALVVILLLVAAVVVVVVGTMTCSTLHPVPLPCC